MECGKAAQSSFWGMLSSSILPKSVEGTARAVHAYDEILQRIPMKSRRK
jgi:hypothetical protein